MWIRGLARTGVFLAVVLLLAGPAGASGLIEEGITLSARFDGDALDLEALVVRPDDGGRHPLVLLSHGAPRRAEDREGMHASAQLSKAREFARRGWVAVAVMRRGYGNSEGDYVESSGRCDNPDYVGSGRRSAEDLRQAIRAMAAKPYVDASKVVAVGQSAGGFASVALAADPPPGLAAVINFAGGRGSTKPDEVCVADRLVAAFATFGRTARVPMLWVYTENDHYFGPRLANRFHTAFTEAGGRAQLIRAPAFGDDGHLLFSTKGIGLWTSYVDDFLAAQGLTQFARPLPPRDVSAISYPSGLSDKGRAAYAQFLDAGRHKAFAMSKTGAYGWRSGRSSTDEAMEEALEKCTNFSTKRCFLVMVDDEAIQ
ncbi:dienelactone hydrolase [Paramagnetospirillum marisnigri]|uniref:Dienelactone hydrolase n=1 Tax=Paramagnetospirillum marisnigri TaxID=1285242 RepID=A0A178MRP8_9PROT|nr:CocE/NonD family hydrolase [Paramagnetospirillum marisnigri]OAN50755.1 dienelactone hydrolase [Paramagnetospirillum marisnigri]